MMLKYLFFLLVSAVGFGQATIRPNVNIDARELTYKLSGDTLKIKSEKNIMSIVIRSNEFRRQYHPNQRTANIIIKEYPKGYYVIIVVTNKKIITFNMTI